MSEYKFVNYKKLDEHAHTNRMLEDDHGDIPDSVIGKQLESQHVGVEEYIMEHLLEKSRTGSSDVIIEKNLNDSKSKFDSKFRDPSAYEGDISKLEEKRLAQYNTEKEKYELASETPKAQRWWEVKSPDNLKIAQKKHAQVDETMLDINWDEADRRNNSSNFDLINSFDIDGIEDDDFEVEDLDGDFEVEDLGEDLGEDFEVSDVESDLYNEISYKEVDVGGTPTAVGVIKIEDGYDPIDIESELREFMEVNHSDLPFSLDSFDLSKLSQGIITYSVVSGLEDELPTEEDFSVDELSNEENFEISSSKKKLV